MPGPSKKNNNAKSKRRANQHQQSTSNRQTDKLILSHSSTPTLTTNQSQSSEIFFKPYDLDYEAQKLVLANRDKKNVLNESHKMRMAVAYGLERFWGEHLRYLSQRGSENINKGLYWKSVWDKLVEILKQGGIEIPNPSIGSNQNEEQTKQIQEMAQALWSVSLDDQRVALMVLSQFCDSLVWWTQRYKKRNTTSDQSEEG